MVFRYSGGTAHYTGIETHILTQRVKIIYVSTNIDIYSPRSSGIYNVKKKVGISLMHF